MFAIVPPSPSLRPLVLGYWFVRDLAGRHEGQPIRTSPHASAILTINIGRPNADDTGAPVPVASLLGPQTRARRWRSGPNTYFVMVVLSAHGLIALFPSTGPYTANNVVDLAGVIGDRRTHHVVSDLSAAANPRRIAAQLDEWLQRRSAALRPPPEMARFVRACECLAKMERVEIAAARIGVSRRQLHRWSHTHLGVGPKEFAQLHRLQTSLHRIQTGAGDPLAGFSDQAHQIRTWRARLGVTPAAYKESALARLAKTENDSVSLTPELSHYL